MGGPAGSIDRTQAVGDQCRTYSRQPRSIGIIGIPESAMEEISMYPIGKSSLPCGIHCGRSWAKPWSLFWTIPDRRWSHGRRKQRCWLLALTNMLGLPGSSRVRSAATA